jgi:hypothetical protein
LRGLPIVVRKAGLAQLLRQAVARHP